MFLLVQLDISVPPPLAGLVSRSRMDSRPPPNHALMRKKQPDEGVVGQIQWRDLEQQQDKKKTSCVDNNNKRKNNNNMSNVGSSLDDASVCNLRQMFFSRWVAHGINTSFNLHSRHLIFSSCPLTKLNSGTMATGWAWKNATLLCHNPSSGVVHLAFHFALHFGEVELWPRIKWPSTVAFRPPCLSYEEQSRLTLPIDVTLSE